MRPSVHRDSSLFGTLVPNRGNHLGLWWSAQLMSLKCIGANCISDKFPRDWNDSRKKALVNKLLHQWGDVATYRRCLCKRYLTRENEARLKNIVANLINYGQHLNHNMDVIIDNSRDLLWCAAHIVLYMKLWTLIYRMQTREGMKSFLANRFHCNIESRL